MKPFTAIQAMASLSICVFLAACGGSSSSTGSDATTPETMKQVSAHQQASPLYSWVAGSDLVDQSGHYGELGIPGPDNNPGARTYSSSWTTYGTDGKATFWLFGGHFYNDEMNDLWKYRDGQWTWVSGANTPNQTGNYREGETNYPGARTDAMSWTDQAGNLWLFGGMASDSEGISVLNDLWKFDPATNQWTWVSGSDTPNQAGVYVNKGQPGMPGARSMAVTWTDNQGNLWLFGGVMYNAGMSGNFNDLWKFSPANGVWTWVNGADTLNQPGSYGMETGQPADNIFPGARRESGGWTDADGNLWLFGGSGYAEYGSGYQFEYGYLNDLWKYNLSSNQWTFVGGSRSAGDEGRNAGKGEFSPDNLPSARNNFKIWADQDGSVWLFGGSTNKDYIFPAYSFGNLNDLWHYFPIANEWVWVGGDTATNQSGVYGTKGVPSATNTPGSRSNPSGWVDTEGSLYLFGGSFDFGYGAGQYGNFNDLWKIQLPRQSASNTTAQQQ